MQDSPQLWDDRPRQARTAMTAKTAEEVKRERADDDAPSEMAIALMVLRIIVWFCCFVFVLFQIAFFILYTPIDKSTFQQTELCATYGFRVVAAFIVAKSFDQLTRV